MRTYYGWRIVAISIVALTVAIGGSIQAFGLFVVPVSENLHLTRAQVNTSAILLNFGMAVCGPVVGRMLDRYSARLVAAVSAVLFGGSLVALGLSGNIWFSALVILVPLAASAVGSGTVTSPALVSRWFTHQRGRAMAIAMLGISVGPIAVVPIVGLLIEWWGWREALVVAGIGGGALLLLMALLIRDAPGPTDVEPASAVSTTAADAVPDAPGEPLAVARLLRLPQFWSISVGLALIYGIMQVLIVSLVPFGIGKGLLLTQAGSLISMYGASAICGSLLIAWLGDRFGRVLLLSALAGAFTVAAAVPALAGGYVALLVSTACIGVVGGAITPIFLALLADLFGPASFGTVNGSASLISTLFGAVFIRMGGEIFDRTGSYQLMFAAFLVTGAVGTLLVFATGPLSRRDPVRPA